MSIEDRTIRPSTGRGPALSRNNLLVLSAFIVFMALNSILRFKTNIAEPRFNAEDIGERLGTGFGSLFLFWLICKGASISRAIDMKSNIFQISMGVLSLISYVVIWIWFVKNTTDSLVVILAAVPLVPVFYFVIGAIGGLFFRASSNFQK